MVGVNKKNIIVTMLSILDSLVRNEKIGDMEMVSKDAGGKITVGQDSALFHLCRGIYERSIHFPNVFQLNGEKNLIDKLRGEPFSTFFDVGANKGVWSTYANRIFPRGSFHLFEIVPDTCRKLEVNLSGFGNCTINEFGLSDDSGKVEVFLFDSDLLSSIYPSNSGEEIKVNSIISPVMSGDDYAALNSVDSIDFLKIDVEGAEKKGVERI